MINSVNYDHSASAPTSNHLQLSRDLLFQFRDMGNNTDHSSLFIQSHQSVHGDVQCFRIKGTEPFINK